MAVKDLLVRVLGDTRDVERAFARSSKAANTFGASVDTTAAKADKGLKSLKGFATGTAAGFGGAIVFNELSQQLGAAIDIASNLQEQISRTKVVFGESADEIVAWSRTTAKSLGVAQDEALAAAGTFGAMFDQAGRSAADAAGLSRSVVQLASDLSSFNNLPIDDSLNALRSGLSGEIEPLRRFQVFLTEAAVSARAMADSNKSAVDQLTQGEKIMARWNLILGQTTKQQGDFGRTSEGLANSQRILAAQTRDLQAQIGGALVPVMESFTGSMVEATDIALELADALGALARIKIPTIVIPFTTKEVGGGTIGGAAGKVAGLGVLGAISPAALFAVGVKEAVDRIRGEQPPTKDINNLAKSFDEQFSLFTDQTVKAVNQSVNKANTRIKSFGEKGFKPLEVNQLGETLQRQFEASLDALDLQFDQARFAGSDQAALSALDKIEATIRRRIESQGRTTELMRDLFEVEQERARILREGKEEAQAAAREAQELARAQEKAAREAQKALEQRNQFRAIGLSATGGDITPTVANLRKQFEQLSKNVVGQDVSSKLLARLKLVGNALAGGIKKMTPETRAAIKDLFEAIRSEFDDQTQKDIIPPRRVQISDKILKALGFDQDAQVKAFRGVRQFTGATFPTGASRPIGTPTATTGGVTITGPVTVVADNPDAFLRELQKKAGRTTATSRGRFPGKSLGLG